MTSEVSFRSEIYQAAKLCVPNAMTASVLTLLIGQVASTNIYCKILAAAVIGFNGLKTLKAHPDFEDEMDSYRLNPPVEQFNLAFRVGFDCLREGSSLFVGQSLDSAKALTSAVAKNFRHEEGSKDAAYKALKSTLTPACTLVTACGIAFFALSTIAVGAISISRELTVCGVYPLAEKFKDKIHPRSVSYGVAVGLVTLATASVASFTSWKTALIMSAAFSGGSAGAKSLV